MVGWVGCIVLRWVGGSGVGGVLVRGGVGGGVFCGW